MSGPIRPGDLVRVEPDRLFDLPRHERTTAARPSGTEHWSVELEADTILLVVLGPRRCGNSPGRPHFVRVLHEGQLLDVMYEDVECMNEAQQ